MSLIHWGVLHLVFAVVGVSELLGVSLNGAANRRAAGSLASTERQTYSAGLIAHSECQY